LNHYYTVSKELGPLESDKVPLDWHWQAFKKSDHSRKLLIRSLLSPTGNTLGAFQTNPLRRLIVLHHLIFPSLYVQCNLSHNLNNWKNYGRWNLVFQSAMHVLHVRSRHSSVYQCMQTWKEQVIVHTLTLPHLGHGLCGLLRKFISCH